MDQHELNAFNEAVLPQLDAAYNLARWLTRNDSDAQDVVQESFIRALRYFDRLKGTEARPWLLGIVRNNCYTWLDEQRRRPGHVEFDEEVMESPAVLPQAAPSDPGAILDGMRQRARVDAAIRALAPPFREVIVLRELEDLSYAEIAQVASIPIGTVMSRLSRARAELKAALADAA